MTRKPLPHIRAPWLTCCTMGWLCALIMSTVIAAPSNSPTALPSPLNTLRDPTRPPTSVDATVSPTGAPSASFRPSQILVVNGTRYLLVNGQKLQVGDALDNKRIERIDDAAIWLRDGAQTQKIPLFEGVEKIIPAAAPKSTAAASHTNTKKCNDTEGIDCSKPKKAAPPSTTPANKAGKPIKTQGEK